MADDGNKSEGAAGAAASQAGAGGTAAPSINVLGQYIKDLSFENPKAPDSFGNQKEPSPPVNIAVNVSAKPVGEANIEVELRIEARAGVPESVLFNLELVYAGLFQIRNVPQEQVHPFVLIECPRLLFPFARQIVADTIASGGFPPVMLDPIDFAQLYRQRMAQQANQPSQESAPSSQPN
jgi:preprotein translocase subunit SecB